MAKLSKGSKEELQVKSRNLKMSLRPLRMPRMNSQIKTLILKFIAKVTSTLRRMKSRLLTSIFSKIHILLQEQNTKLRKLMQFYIQTLIKT